jgi:hypothetical protein
MFGEELADVVMVVASISNDNTALSRVRRSPLLDPVENSDNIRLG